MTFEGYTDETIEFFMAIRFNNNREFFLENRDWYLRAVREPSLALAEALGPAVEGMDASLERAPSRVVSRINRDVRFSNDKSPYRDNVWMAFRKPGEERKTTLGVYFEINAEAAYFGMGYYSENRPAMNALRRRMRVAPEEMLPLAANALQSFELKGEPFKRIAMPDGLPEALVPWYRMRAFYLEREVPLRVAKTPALVDEISAGYRRLKPLYDYIMSLKPEEVDLL